MPRRESYTVYARATVDDITTTWAEEENVDNREDAILIAAELAIDRGWHTHITDRFGAAILAFLPGSDLARRTLANHRRDT